MTIIAGLLFAWGLFDIIVAFGLLLGAVVLGISFLGQQLIYGCIPKQPHIPSAEEKKLEELKKHVMEQREKYSDFLNK